MMSNACIGLRPRVCFLWTGILCNCGCKYKLSGVGVGGKRGLLVVLILKNNRFLKYD